VSDLIAGRARIDLRVIDATKTLAEVILFPAREDSILIPEQVGNHSVTSDGAWNVTSSLFSARRVFLPTLGDPAADSAQTSHPEVAASFVLTRASPTLSEMARRIVPEQLAWAVVVAMVCLLLVIRTLGRFDSSPGPWRRFAVLLTLTLLLAAAQRVFEAEI